MPNVLRFCSNYPNCARKINTAGLESVSDPTATQKHIAQQHISLLAKDF